MKLKEFEAVVLNELSIEMGLIGEGQGSGLSINGKAIAPQDQLRYKPLLQAIRKTFPTEWEQIQEYKEPIDINIEGGQITFISDQSGQQIGPYKLEGTALLQHLQQLGLA